MLIKEKICLIVKIMWRFIFLLVLLVVGFSCKKTSDDDIIQYSWNRELFRARVHQDGPATFGDKDPRVVRNKDVIFIQADVVILTEFRKDQQQDSIFIASGRTLVYKYEKMKRVGN